MATLQGKLRLTRSVISEVTTDAQDSKVIVVSGTAGDTGGGGGKTDQRTQAGEFRTYGNGNVRLILGAGQSRSQTLALRAITSAQVAQVESLLGHTVCYRDTYGRKVFGAFLDMQTTAIPFSGSYENGDLLHNVALVIQSITHDEEV
jgi:hypothetical protein